MESSSSLPSSLESKRPWLMSFPPCTYVLQLGRHSNLRPALSALRRGLQVVTNTGLRPRCWGFAQTYPKGCVCRNYYLKLNQAVEVRATARQAWALLAQRGRVSSPQRTHASVDVDITPYRGYGDTLDVVSAGAGAGFPFFSRSPAGGT